MAVSAFLQVLTSITVGRQAVACFRFGGGEMRGPEGGQQCLAALLISGRRLAVGGADHPDSQDATPPCQAGQGCYRPRPMA
ncbi:hypothetical protein E2C01_085542 [Portunus trituberculatus]|uniref:Uncharacterized protein n=1 Tax=Portunus trituberculatus TaxID=210409 RepID=A0A5B7J706_PORTR|nr:hypothetical protein [Portunus trituberculatus]